MEFVPRRTVEDAVSDLVAAFRSGKIPESVGNPKSFNTKTTRRVNLE